MINIDTGLYILGGITTAASALGAYFSQRNHAKLNGNSTIQITSQPVTMAAPKTTTQAHTIVVDGVTYTESK
jgi:hypothetical protein